MPSTLLAPSKAPGIEDGFSVDESTTAAVAAVVDLTGVGTSSRIATVVSQS
jgi:hypothetical protein